ncbi:MAG TPA: hypothetical protein ENI05_12735 [Porticoccus sp.]|nr:hypothetical protein [Porticoccus sp.]
MVEVRFACIPSVAGVECSLDGAVQFSNESGIASFMGISQGAHSYSVKAPAGWVFVSGEDTFKRPLPSSGTTIIEWLPIPGQPWPEANPWMMMFTFKEGIAPEPPTVPAGFIEKIVTAGIIGSILIWLGFRQ